MKRLLLTILLQFVIQYSFPQICNKGKLVEVSHMENIVEPNSVAEGTASVYITVDPIEIIGTRGYDVIDDTLQRVAATASLPYTIYFENDLELATAAAPKVEIHYAYYSIMN